MMLDYLRNWWRLRRHSAASRRMDFDPLAEAWRRAMRGEE